MMIELKYPESIYNERFDINIRPYLKLDEVEVIAEAMLKLEKTTERELIKNVLILKFTTDIENLDNKDYDLMKASGLIDEVLFMIDTTLIDEYIYEQEKIERTVKTFLTTIEKVVEKVQFPKEKEWGKFIDKLKTVVNKDDSDKK